MGHLCKTKTRLRSLREDDANLMLEWMHDPEIQKGFKRNMLNTTIEDAQDFCSKALIPKKIKNGDSLHFAITDESDEYLGTISLKNIDTDNKTAEYAVIIRRVAQGKGVAFEATGQILKKAFNEIGLHKVFLSVLAENEAAIKLYEKCGFKYEGEFRDHFIIGGKYMNWKWYSILECEYDEQLFGGI